MSTRWVWLFVVGTASPIGACHVNAPPQETCAPGECCFVGVDELSLEMRKPRLAQKAPDTTTVTTNFPCGSSGVQCEAHMCCDEGYICGPPKGSSQ